MPKWIFQKISGDQQGVWRHHTKFYEILKFICQTNKDVWSNFVAFLENLSLYTLADNKIFDYQSILSKIVDVEQRMDSKGWEPVQQHGFWN